MKKAEIVKSMNGFLSKTSFQLKKHSPGDSRCGWSYRRGYKRGNGL